MCMVVYVGTMCGILAAARSIKTVCWGHQPCQACHEWTALHVVLQTDQCLQMQIVSDNIMIASTLAQQAPPTHSICSPLPLACNMTICREAPRLSGTGSHNLAGIPALLPAPGSLRV